MEEGERSAVENDANGVPRQPPAQAAARPAPATRRRALVSLVVLAVAAAVLLRLYVYESDIVEGSSMRPGLRSGDFVLVSKIAYRRPAPRRFDVITLSAPGKRREVVIKRVVGLPGEWVWVWSNHVFVNGGRLVEPYTASWRGDFRSPVRVPENSVYVLGDNRDDSDDSRAWGPVALSSVRGKAIFVYFPFGRARRVQ
ncbi:MAG TPA: signal peptidase I [Armatimonadota bacterium]|nr:signal peptidase I [Armatimonadota bacterium]